MFQRILIAWDGSEVALRAFDVAIDLTRRYGAELAAVSIARSPARAETDADRHESADAAHRYLGDTFAEVVDRAERVGVSVEHSIIDGDTPAQALVNHAREHGFDLLVCGHHHSNRVGRLLLRGVSRDLLTATTIPVLVVSDEPR
ncbi:MAG: universal stress protein [Actinobacteria bacterium]|nr:universal stress protein [Actinomycetota bacterium]